MEPYYEHGGITIYHGDCRDILPDWPFAYDSTELDMLVIDPPWDSEAAEWTNFPQSRNALVFTDPRRMNQAVRLYGSKIAWVFTWDTMAGWSTGKSRPVQQTKFALWYGDLDEYRRDAELWGEAPAPRDHPSTKQTPLKGRRLVDLWRESLRWLHNPTAGIGGSKSGTARFGTRRGKDVMRHAKPVGWLRCMLGNCSDGGLILDPFMGSGTTLRAAKDLGRKAIGIEIEEKYCEIAAQRMGQEYFDFEQADGGEEE